MRLYTHTHYFFLDLYLLFNLLFIIILFYSLCTIYIHTSFSYFVYINKNKIFFVFSDELLHASRSSNQIMQ